MEVGLVEETPHVGYDAWVVTLRYLPIYVARQAKQFRLQNLETILPAFPSKTISRMMPKRRFT
jgi:hypothetical protein